MNPTYQATVISNREIAPGAFLLDFRRPFKFIPGQVISLGLGAGIEPRLYSIASGNNDELIAILYTVNASGVLTPALSQLGPGDTVLHSRPFGRFVGDVGRAVWIAAGTGIAPFASMVASGLFQNKTLIYGSKNSERLYFHEMFVRIMGDKYLPCCSRESCEGMFHGRVTDFLKLMKEVDPTVPYYLCGSAEMVVEVRDLLIERRVPFDRIFAEIFF